MQLTTNFWLNEFVKSQSAIRAGINNTPTTEIIVKLQLLCAKVLQPLRDHYKMTVTVNSGYRCPELNAKIGGSPTSQHMQGEAADIEIYGLSNYDVALWIKNNLEFDQLILEEYVHGDPNSGWVHVSYAAGKNRKQVLTKPLGVSKFVAGLLPN